jgi:release factor glutamine methyltransferase
LTIVAISSIEIQPPPLSAFMKVLRRLLFLTAYFGWVKHTMSRSVSTSSLGFSLTIPPTVFHPRFYFTSEFFGEYISTLHLDGKNVLDIGCGSGILSLVAARSGGAVTAIDINPSAVRATRDNAGRNGLLGTIRVVESDLFAGLDQSAKRFDLILSNPPFYSGEARTMTERAFRGGSGVEFMARVAHDSPSFLAHGGSIFLVLSSDADLQSCLRPFEENRFRARVVKVRKLLFETLSIIELGRT